MVASNTAERAIAGLRNALDECDRTLAERLGTAERYAADIAAQVQAGEGVLARIGAIVSEMGAPRAPRAAPPAPPAPEPVMAAPPPPQSPNGERLGAAAAAALAM